MMSRTAITKLGRTESDLVRVGISLIAKDFPSKTRISIFGMTERSLQRRGQGSAALFHQKGNTGMVSIVILNWNGKQFLAECLSSLKLTNYPSFRVIVVDNGSSDGSAEMVRQQFPEVEVVGLPENLGYPKGNNIGIKSALAHDEPAYVFLMNNDMEVIDQDWLRKLVDFAESSENVGITGSLLVSSDGRPQQVGLELIPGVFLPIFRRPMRKVTIGGGLIKRDLIDKIGLLDEGYQRVLFEDVDYMTRAEKAGYKVHLCQSSRLLHYGSVSVSRLPTHEGSYLYRRNGIRYIRKYYPLMFFPFVIMSYLGCLTNLQRVPRRRGNYLKEALKVTTRAIASGMM